MGYRIRRTRMVSPRSQRIRTCPDRLDLIRQTAPEDDLNENVTYHYKYTSSRTSDRTGNTAGGNYYASDNSSGSTLWE